MPHGEVDDIRDHERNAAAICGSLMTLVERDDNLVISHRNGPQVGKLLLQSELTRDEVPFMPLDALVANTEGLLKAGGEARVHHQSGPLALALDGRAGTHFVGKI